jgi:hypothetical protein
MSNVEGLSAAHWTQQKPAGSRRWLVGATAAGLGGALGSWAWSPGHSPALAVLLPILWIMAPDRGAAAGVLGAYALACVRFLPAMAGAWYGSWLAGAAMWLSIGLVAAAVGAILWPRQNSYAWVTGMTVSLLALTLATPLAAVVPGHPLVGWGYLLPGWGWFGVVAMFLLTTTLAVTLRIWVRERFPRKKWIVALVFAVAVSLCVKLGVVPDPDGGRLAGRVGAINTAWGPFPQPRSPEALERIGKIAEATRNLAGGEDGLDTVVFPEAIIGLYEPSLFPVLEVELFRVIRRTGQTVIIGADLQIGPGRFENIALILRPDGTSSWIAARQTSPVSQWAPWSDRLHFPASWLSDSTAPIGRGIQGRFMFCHEEYMPILHLLSEAQGDHQLVVSLANLWAADDPLANSVQASYTQGMVLLFRRNWVRSVNLPRAQK